MYFLDVFLITGAFSRSALKSRCGVRILLAKVFSKLCVPVDIYTLTGPPICISGVPMAAFLIYLVKDLVASKKSYLMLYRVIPVGFFNFLFI